MRVSESWLEGEKERERESRREGRERGEKGWSVRVMAEGRVRLRRKESIKVGLKRKEKDREFRSTNEAGVVYPAPQKCTIHLTAKLDSHLTVNPGQCCRLRTRN